MKQFFACVCFVLCLSLASTVSALAADVAGTVRDETGGALPGVSVELRSGSAAPRLAVTDARGAYAFDSVPPGPAHVVFTLINFAASRRDAVVPAGGNVRVDVVLHLALNADVIVTGKSTFTNLADADRPAENLVGIAQSASQGAITAQQLDARPMSRAGEVLETVPGSLESVVSLGATVDGLHGLFGSARLRSFGPRPLIESGSVRSKATGLVNVEAGCKIAKGVRVALDVFNLLDAKASDIDYYYKSRLPGEPLGGIDDIHFHPAAPRTARVSLIVGR